MFSKSGIALATLLCLIGCGSAAQKPSSLDGGSADANLAPETAPLVLGEFVDDYGIRYRISQEEWFQFPGSTFRITKWDTEQKYVIAHNHPDNPGEGGLWTRIDWIVLPDMPKYPWAFCLSAYDAASAEEAEAASANREQPRTGCNGFPFSRMQQYEAP